MNSAIPGTGAGFIPELLELLDEGVVLHGSDGSVLSCNPAAERILGLSCLRLPQRRSLFASLEALTEDGEPLTAEDEPAMRALRTGERRAGQRVRIRRPDGEITWLQLKCVPLFEAQSGDGGAPASSISGAMTIIRDLSDQLLVEQRLRGDAGEDVFSHLAGSVAHDFNHFLTVIVGYSDLMLQNIPPGDVVREQAEHIRLAANGATTLTRELMDFSRRQRCSDGAMDLAFTISEMQPMLTRVLGPRVRLRLDLDRTSAWVRANPAQLERVIFNLALNSRDAMREGGELRISTRPIEIDEAFVTRHPGAHAGRFVRLTVSDEGVGMDAATRRRLFEPFFTTKPPGQGTGLGLATVWGIVKQFGGYIEVDSEPGKGAEFRIDLPAQAVGGGTTPAPQR